MIEDELQRGIRIQQGISARLAQFAYADRDRGERISRDMAEVAVKGQTFAEEMVPLFLQLPRDNPSAIAQLSLAMKVHLEELTDALLDLRQELPEWTEFFSELARK